MSNEKAPWEIEDDEVLAPWEVDDTQEEVAPWEIADDEVEPNTPPPYLSVQGPVVPAEPELTTEGILEGLGQASTELETLDNPNQPGYRGDGSVNYEDPRWRGMKPYQIESQKSRDTLSSFFSSIPEVYDELVKSAWTDAPTIGDLSEEEQEVIQQQAIPAEHTVEAGVERNKVATDLRIEEEVDKRVAEKKKAGEKIDRPQIKEEVKEEFKDHARDLTKDVAIGVATLGVGAPAMLARYAPQGSKALQYAAKVADQGIFGAAFAGGDQVLSNLIRGEDLTKDLGTSTSIGGALGVGGKVLGDAAGKVADYVVDKRASKALEELNELGKKGKFHKDNSNEFSPDLKDTPIAKNTSADDILKTKEGAEELVKLNKDGGHIGTFTLAESTKSPEIKRLLEESATRTEKVARKVTGTKGNVARNKVAEAVGLRAENLKSKRSDAFKASNHKVDNELEDILDDVKALVKNKELPKENLTEVKEFSKYLKSARAAGNSGNMAKYSKHISKAEKTLKSISKSDDYLGEALQQQLVKTKATAKVKGAVSKGEENTAVVDIMTSLGSFALPMVMNGYDHSDLLAGTVGAAASTWARRKASNRFSKNVDKRLSTVEKALQGKLNKGDLNALKSKYKKVDALRNGTPDGAMLRAYLALKEDE